MISFFKTFALDGFSAINWISLVLCYCWSKSSLLMYSSQKFYFLCFSLLSMHFFFSPQAFSYHPRQFGIETSQSFYLSFGNQCHLFHLGELMWLSCIPCGSLLDWVNQCNYIEASIASTWPSLTVQKCGICLVTAW